MENKKILLAAALLSLCVVSCQKEEKVITRFTAGMERPSAKTHLDRDGMTLKWDSNDTVMVYNSSEATEGVAFTASNLREDDTKADLVSTGISEGSQYYAIHPISIAASAGSVILPAEQHSDDGSLADFPMYAQSESNVFQFNNLCGALKIHLEQSGVDIKRIKVKADRNINGTYTIGEDLTLANVEGTGSNTTVLILNDAQSIGGDGHDFYIYLPAGENISMDLTFYKADGTCCTKSGTVSVERSKYSPIEIDGGLSFEYPEGSLPGLFIVDESGQEVRFSQGNLQWSATNGGSIATTHNVNGGGTAAGTWRFAEHQYDFMGNANINATNRSTGWIDLFGWGTSGYNGKSPNMTSTTNSDYGNGSADIAGTNYDWGVYNAISNGGNIPGQWRTLTHAEWNYILNGRNGASGKKALGRIVVSEDVSVNGLIVVPDNWTGSGFNNGGYASNTYTLDQWEDMEAAGAIFLPAAGNRYGVGQRPSDHINSGLYWTTTSVSNQAYLHYFTGGTTLTYGVTEINKYNRLWGLSVRLVQEAN